ncbi:unnamed protein product [Paramecium sonneborni]|uniref:HTH CENPB-type domain-containing protein n=1 Tax=Paramecium sonneborni TaxID=65129 RepID=A0A8S1KY28_9CILI|nr:unnamed protein product [Paramecium sonneborni]
MVNQNLEIQEKKIHTYKVLSINQKKEALEELFKNPSQENFILLSNKFNTTTRNLRRWFNEGYMRKGGCGRKKINPQGVMRLEEWILEETKKYGKKISRNQIKEQAIRIFNIQSFKASKVWMDKFIKEQNLKYKIQTILFEKGQLSKQSQEIKHKQFEDNQKEKNFESSTKKQIKGLKLEKIKLNQLERNQDQLNVQDLKMSVQQETILNREHNKEDDLYLSVSFEQEADLFAYNYEEELFLGFD